MDARGQERLATVIDILFYAALGGLLYFFARYFLAWTLPFFLGAGIAALMRPTALRLSRALRLNERAAAVLSVGCFYLAAAGLLTVFLTIVLAQAYELLSQLPGLYARSIAPLLERLGGWFYGLAARFAPDAGGGLESFYGAVSEAVRTAAVEGSSRLVAWCAGLVAKLPLLLLGAVFTVMISVLAATGYRELGAFLRGLTPRALRGRLEGLQTFLRETVWRMVRAYTIIMAITFSELALGLWLLGFGYVLPVAACITLLDILPLIGSGTVLVPWAVVLLAGGDTAGGAGLLCLFGIIAVVRKIVEPRVVGGQIGLHPIATITAMYAGLRIAGFWGLLLAPVTVLLLRHLLREEPEG